MPAGIGGNCAHDVTGNGVINLLGLAGVADHYGQTSGSPGWDPRVDVNADGVISIFDLSAVASEYRSTVTYCAYNAEYPYYPPGTWAGGTLPSDPDYHWTQYLLLTGAIKYAGSGGPSCTGGLGAWEFVSIPSGTGDLNMCAALEGLVALGNKVASGTAGAYASIYVGPNDCTALMNDGSVNSIADAANAFSTLVFVANQNVPSKVRFQAVVDDEGYVLDASGFCGQQVESQCQTNDVTFFSDYAGLIGPAGAPKCFAGDQQMLSQDGGGRALPQIYNTTNPTTADWPQPIASGYGGIQVCPSCGSFYSAGNGEWAWYVNHQAQPPIDFDWSCAGARC